MRALVLGGTKFVGRHIVQAALDRGYEVTLFNRGRTARGLFSEAEELHGDRDGGLDALHGRTWDAVIDVNGYLPRVVRQSTELLRGAVDHYTFVSTISVYSQPTRGMDENAPLAPLVDETSEDVEEHYGPLKVLCEEVVQEVFDGRNTVIRPGIIAGPYDDTDRFTYWPVRVASGGEVLAPGAPERPVQFIDGRDLGEWTVAVIEAGTQGVFNATGPDYGLTIGGLLDGCAAVTKSGARFEWVPDDFLLQAAGVDPSDLPFWIRASRAAWFMVDCSRAVAAGLTYRPLADTIRGTLEWVRSTGRRLEAGLSRQREVELLEAWRGSAQ